MRRVYNTYAEEKSDQRIGFIVFPIVNIIIAIVIALVNQQMSDASSTANIQSTDTRILWIVNGLVLVVTLIFRTQIGRGYLVSFAGFAAVGVGLGLIYVIAYFLSFPAEGIGGLIGLLVLFLLALGLAIWFLWKMFGLLKRWWKV